MLIKINSIDSVGRHEIAQVPIADMPLLMELIRSGGVGFPAPVTVDVFLMQPDEGVVVVSGTLDTRAVFDCGRCLEAAIVPVRADIRIVFKPVTAAAAAAGELVELTDEDMECVAYDGDTLDLAAVLQEEVIAALPLRPLCQPGCKGLCPECGANLNVSACTCSKTPADPRLAVLKSWRSDT
ncbi:MAG: DUF177 domain-containing protein [Pseudomonadota bacterium]